MLKHEKHINVLKRFISYSTENFDSFLWFSLAQMDVWLITLLIASSVLVTLWPATPFLADCLCKLGIIS